MSSPRLAAAALFACLASPALAGPDEVEGTVTGGRDYRSYSHDRIVLPAHSATIEAVLRFLTSDGGPDVPPLRFTDAALLDLSARYALGGSGARGEVFAGASLLPKQPSTLGARLWQGATLGGRLALAPELALSLTERVGPQLAVGGLWSETSLLTEYKYEMGSSFRLRLEAGMAATAFGSAPTSVAWFGEVLAQVTASVHASRVWAGWVGAEYRLPVNAPAGLLPQPRLNAKIGTVFSPIEEWDLFFQTDYVDRGDAVNPPTTLPILDGGFDQVTLTFGITRRFGVP